MQTTTKNNLGETKRTIKKKKINKERENLKNKIIIIILMNRNYLKMTQMHYVQIMTYY